MSIKERLKDVDKKEKNYFRKSKEWLRMISIAETDTGGKPVFLFYTAAALW